MLTADADADSAWTELAMAHLSAGHPLEIRARGRSMWPTLREGERLRIEPVVGKPRIGDVVLFRRGGRLVLHRVTWIAERGVYTRGDASLALEGPIDAGAVLGQLASEFDRGRRGLAGRAARIAAPLLRVGAELRTAILRRKDSWSSAR